ncbi:hypothetical protein GCM10008107_14600 [Psychrosphaera saromensis]|nr:hypothetical protein GCM10008107_14600 [Psychrosphaera saromensis]GLQ14916.1 hypothetical protein GCM10007917_23710 [Psychrosphaera saromensis]
MLRIFFILVVALASYTYYRDNGEIKIGLMVILVWLVVSLIHSYYVKFFPRVNKLSTPENNSQM